MEKIDSKTSGASLLQPTDEIADLTQPALSRSLAVKIIANGISTLNRDESSPEDRLKAASSLGNAGKIVADHVPWILTQQFTHSEHPNVREALAKSAYKLDPALIMELGERRLLNHSSIQERKDGVLFLAQAEGEDVATSNDILWRIYSNPSENVEVRKEVVRTLATFDPLRLKTNVQDLFSTQGFSIDKSLILNAASYDLRLATLIREQLIKALDDPDRRVWNSAVVAVGLTQEPSTLELLKDELAKVILTGEPFQNGLRQVLEGFKAHAKVDKDTLRAVVWLEDVLDQWSHPDQASRLLLRNFTNHVFTRRAQSGGKEFPPIDDCSEFLENLRGNFEEALKSGYRK